MKKMKVWLLLAFQLIFLMVLVFGDIGFDHPGRFGLAIEHGMLVAFLYLVTLIGGIVLAVRKRAWGLLLAQFVLPLAVLIFQSWPAPTFDATQYQYLVGKTEPDVDEILHHAQHVSGMSTEKNGERRTFAGYRGMTVIYSQNGVVIAVEPGTQ